MTASASSCSAPESVSTYARIFSVGAPDPNAAPMRVVADGLACALLSTCDRPIFLSWPILPCARKRSPRWMKLKSCVTPPIEAVLGTGWGSGSPTSAFVALNSIAPMPGQPLGDDLDVRARSGRR